MDGNDEAIETVFYRIAATCGIGSNHGAPHCHRFLCASRYAFAIVRRKNVDARTPYPRPHIVDLLIDPLYHVFDGRDAATVFALRVASKAGDRAQFGDTVDGILQGSADSYAQTRLIWLMNRRFDLGETGDDYDPYDDDAIIDPYAE